LICHQYVGVSFGKHQRKKFILWQTPKEKIYPLANTKGKFLSFGKHLIYAIDLVMVTGLDRNHAGNALRRVIDKNLLSINLIERSTGGVLAKIFYRSI
jgi:hypothetical protein